MKKRPGLAAVQSGWIESELAKCKSHDERHAQRLRKLLGQFSQNIGGSIPWASQDWANTKAAYRFFSNPRISEAEILSKTPRTNFCSNPMISARGVSDQG